MLIGLLPAVALAVVVVVDQPSRGRVLAAVALVAVPALPLWWRWHSGAFRLSAGLIGGAFSIVSLWAALSGGLLLLPTGLLLLSAALLPPRWTLLRALVVVALLVGAVVVVPFALYGAYNCARPAPELKVTLRRGFSSAVVDASVRGQTAVERRGDTYLIEFPRGHADQRDAAVRRLRQHPSVALVAKGEKRCD